ncbi:prepilin-type N-terminal cleavage/methylation domain-containing protein [Telmatospirillum siberiense]|uniref:Prepilin-type cleavage/methylation domain-containing protein n=1 Tax=Telmatospirillum siberiense TaxID=382514 RepID=A0A2N3Q1Z8_9PROT|nr:prepilin-type N-terminal cleavage/methylation domain-containing protein [Telmatospirillum siberiense]PKU26665.1 hypothetical protein CWS72_01340 [Telmatospirillum siberiense]
MTEVAPSGGFLSRAGDCRNGQHGFTLIEMSIVLVIIGLIIGGIIKGQEVVNSARVKMQVAQIDAVRGAVYTFQDRYGYYPGDLTGRTTFGFTALTAATDGNQDGMIGAFQAAAPAYLADNANDTGNESQIVWLDLAAADLLSGIVVSSGNVFTSTSATYAGKIGGTFLTIGSYNMAANGGPAVRAPILRIQGNAPAAAVPTVGLKEADASGMDAKYDDGNPGTGTILVNTATYGTCTNPAPTTADPGVGRYVVSGVNPNSVSCVENFILQ